MCTQPMKAAASARVPDRTPITLARSTYCIPNACVVLTVSSQGVVIVDAQQPEHPIIFANPAFEELTGYTQHEILGRNCRFLQGADTDPQARAQIRSALGAGKGCRVTLRNYRKDGTPFWNELVISPVHGEDGTLTHFVGIQNDITARVQAEQACDHFFALSPDLLCIAGTDGFFQRINPAFTTILGYSEAELLARPFTDFVHPDDQPATLDTLQLLRTSSVTHFVNRYQHRDGTYRWLEWNGQPIPEQGLVYAVARDITERVMEETTQQARTQQLQQAQKLESLGLLAGGIAHDFNNLLTAIRGHAELALIDMPLDAPARPEVELALNAVMQASGLADLLLTYAGRGPLRVQPLDLNALVQEVLVLLRSSFPANITIHAQFGASLPNALLDASQTRQVVMNLLLNANDAIGGRAGNIIVATSAHTLTAAELSTMIRGESCAPGAYLCLEVADTGCGIAPDTMARMFEPFFSTKPTGRGLGLATVLGIVRAQAGALRVQSTLGVGTAFRLYFAASPATGEAPSQHLPMPSI
jgi:two-component system, cell cycle sensor histidine kinase and response regulator CckA